MKKKAALIDELNEANGNLGDAVANFNEIANKAFSDVEAARIAFNEIISKARDFADEVGADIQAYAEEKSEKWQESEAGGGRYTDWQRAWEDLDLPDAEITEPEELCVDGLEDAVNELIEAPESVDDL